MDPPQGRIVRRIQERIQCISPAQVANGDQRPRLEVNERRVV